MTGQVNSISDRDLRILTHYASGTELKGIAQILGMTREDVMDVVGEFTGYERKKAGDLVAAHTKRQRAQTPKLPVEPIIDRPAPPATPVPAPPKPAAPKVEEQVAPQPAPVPVPDLDIRQISRTPVETVLARAIAAGGRYAKQADKIREQVVALDADLAEQQRVADAEKRVEQARAQLAAATEELRALRGRPVSPAPADRPQVAASTSTIRAWAQDNNIEVNPLGVLPARVVDAFHAANPPQVAA